MIADIILINAREFEAKCLNNNICAFILVISDIVDSSILSIPPITIFSKYFDLAEVFFKKAAYTLPKHGLQHLVMEILETLLLQLLYNFSQIELKVFQEYISNNLAKRLI